MGKSKDLASGNSAAYVETAGDTMTGALKVTGNVGIDTGTITPRDAGASTLQIGGNGTRSAIKMHTSSSGIGATDGLFLGYDSGPHFYILNSEANGDIKIGTSNSLDRLLIDASGRVTAPNQPWFHVVLNSNVTSVSTGNQLLNAWGAGIKGGVGSHFSSNKFTAPVAGKYLFCYSGLHNSGSGGYSRAYHHVNGAVVIDGLGDASTSGAYQRIAYSIILSLAANDYVEIKVNSAQTDAYVYSYYTTWSGQLLS